MSKLEEIQKSLQQLRAAVPELRGVLLASTDGLPVAHSLTDGADPQRFAAMAAAVSGLGRKVGESLGIGTLVDVTIGGSEGQVFVYSAGSKAVLVVITPSSGNTGMIHLEARATARAIAEAL
jgi:uncharacterized protein